MDPIPRNNIINGVKHEAEGLLEETKIILGWFIDFRRFEIALPKHKLKEWIFDMDKAMNNKKIDTKTLESIVGRLNHAGFVLPFGKYFLNRIRQRLKHALKRKYRMTYLEQNEIDDLSLWKKFLFKASVEGININHITFTEPSITCYSDACEFGLGGYIVNGPAWRFGQFSINLLELIASFLTIELAIKWKNDSSYPHRILAFTDSSSALGWLLKSNFDTTTHENHDKVSRDLAWLCYSSNVSLFAQHIEGWRNSIADALSRDFHLSTKHLSDIILSHLPKQVHSQFKIVTHPRDISSWMLSLTCGKLTSPASTGPRMRSSLHILKNGEPTLRTLDSEMFGYNPSKQQTRTSYLQDLHKKSEKMNMEKVKNKEILLANTVAATLSSVSTTFRENAFKNLALDDDNERSIYLQRQMRAYKSKDPPPNGQQCLPLSSFKQIYNDKSSPLNITLGQLIAGALFFACCSCEYSKVNNDEDRKTKILTLGNLRFFQSFKEITNINELQNADFIEITFFSQKN